MNIKIGILNMSKHGNKHDLIHFITKIDRAYLWQKLLVESVSCKFVHALKSMYSTVKLCIKFSPFFTHISASNKGTPAHLYYSCCL